jgi:hypothetical protein
MALLVQTVSSIIGIKARKVQSLRRFSSVEREYRGRQELLVATKKAGELQGRDCGHSVAVF